MPENTLHSMAAPQGACAGALAAARAGRPRATQGQGLGAAFMAFARAMLRPRTALQKAIMGVIALKIVLMCLLRLWLALSGAEKPVADAAMAARLMGPSPAASTSSATLSPPPAAPADHGPGALPSHP